MKLQSKFNQKFEKENYFKNFLVKFQSLIHHCSINSAVECLHDMEVVTSSNLVSSTIRKLSLNKKNTTTNKPNLEKKMSNDYKDAEENHKDDSYDYTNEEPFDEREDEYEYEESDDDFCD